MKGAAEGTGVACVLGSFYCNIYSRSLSITRLFLWEILSLFGWYWVVYYYLLLEQYGNNIHFLTDTVQTNMLSLVSLTLSTDDV